MTYTVNPLYSDLRFNNKPHYIDNLSETNPCLKMIWIIGDVQGCSVRQF